jgi:hypothetical protein
MDIMVVFCSTLSEFENFLLYAVHDCFKHAGGHDIFLLDWRQVLSYDVSLLNIRLVVNSLIDLGPVYRSEIKLIVIKCEINWTRDQIEPIEVPDSWVNRALKFNSN